MSSQTLREFLTLQLRERKNANPLRLGVLCMANSPCWASSLRNDLEARLFEPHLYMPFSERERIENLFDDDTQFVVHSDCTSREECIELIWADAKAGELDLMLVPQDLLQNAQVITMLKSEDSFGAGFALFHPELLDRPLLVGDIFGSSTPDAKRMEEVTRIGAKLLQKINVETPRAALLTAVETVSDSIPATVIAHTAEELLAAETGFRTQGPLSVDLAISPHAAEKKGVVGDVAGRADLMIGPNQTVALGIVQALTCLCEEAAGTVLTGFDVPIGIPGRGESQEGVILSILFAGVLAG